MRHRIVFIIDEAPDVTRGEIAAVVRQASAVFKKAVSPVGHCRRVRPKRSLGDAHKATR